MTERINKDLKALKPSFLVLSSMSRVSAERRDRADTELKESLKTKFPWLPDNFALQRNPEGKEDTAYICERIEKAHKPHELRDNVDDLRRSLYQALHFVRHTRKGWMVETRELEKRTENRILS